MPSRQWFFADAEFSRDLVRGQIIREQRGFDASLECLATDYDLGVRLLSGAPIFGSA